MVSADPEALEGQLGSIVAELQHRANQLIGQLHETNVVVHARSAATTDGQP
jgi:hypothetical protein